MGSLEIMSGEWAKVASSRYLQYAERRALIKEGVSLMGAAVAAPFGYFSAKQLPGDYRKRKASLPPNLAFHYAKNQQQRYAPMHGSFY